ncbi:MFS transporter [Actinoallomurus bryophytorum]|uniref:Putative MFS family arabinose efflux permease n=1 Tax=Actinoallomurus bryophytorum TaxID=1490222 RepID=A0A543CSM5_9ACTN|nr:MFS transporter [Actinoallomurus bryophytorum]TQM00110.1 putative MFS family arabinose efflux permease [Actinoallomurus bryophytorum]
MRAYLDFLRRPHAFRLLGGTLLGRLPNGMAALAIVLFTRAHGGGYTLAGVLSAAYGLAMAAGQPVLGRAMDRFGQPRILASGAIAAAVGFTALAVAGLRPLPVAVGGVLLAGFATPPLEAGLRALWPSVLAGPAEVQSAYALDAAAQELLFTCGPLLVIAAASVSEGAALVFTGLLGVAGTLVVTSSGPSRTWRGEGGGGHWAGPLRSPGIRVLIASLTCVGVALGVFSVAVVTYADARHQSYASGLLLTLMAAGALTGGLVYGRRPREGSAYRRLVLLMTGLAAGYLPLAWAPPFPVMPLLAVCSGVFLAPVLACTFTFVDRLAPRGTVTEAFAWLVTAFGVGSALGAALAGLAGDAVGVHGAFAVAGAGGLLALLLITTGGPLARTAPVTAP